MSNHPPEGDRPDPRPESYAQDHERIESDPRTHPTTDQPLNARPRPTVGPLFAVIALIAAILLVFLVISVVRYST